MASYKDIQIKPGTDAEVAAQVAAIDAKGSSPATSDPAPGDGGTGGKGGTPSDKGGNSAFMTELQKSLMNQSGMVSSADSNIEASINEAIGGVQGAADLNRARIESEYSRERGYKMESNNAAEQGFLENRSGFATPVVAFQNLRDYNAKTIRDLDQRKNELIMMGDANAAEKVAALTLQKLEFEQEAAQRTFTNLLATGGFALQISADQRAEKAFGLQERSQNFAESQAMSAIALQYGITMQEGDTIDTLVTKAMPMASEEQRLKLESVRSQIRQNNAQTSAAIASAARAAREERGLDETTIAAFAAASRNGMDISGYIKDPADFGKVINATNTLEADEVTKYFQQKATEGASMQQAIDEAKNDPAVRIVNFNSAKAIAADVYAQQPVIQKAESGTSKHIRAGVGSYAGGAFGPFGSEIGRRVGGSDTVASFLDFLSDSI